MLSWIWKSVDLFGWSYDKLFPLSALLTVLGTVAVMYLIIDCTLRGL